MNDDGRLDGATPSMCAVDAALDHYLTAAKALQHALGSFAKHAALGGYVSSRWRLRLHADVAAAAEDAHRLARAVTQCELATPEEDVYREALFEVAVRALTAK